jgi:uncharacterized protein (DUF1015 family)
VTVDTGLERLKDARAPVKVALTMTSFGRPPVRIVRWRGPTLRRIPEDSVPDVRPFRALRFDPTTVGDLGAVTAPPYDVIDPAARARLLERHPANVVRLDLPAEEIGDADPDDRYRRAARTLASWRSDGTLRKDPHPSVYVYEQTYRVPGTDTERRQRGFFARLRLEAFGEGGVLPHERTLTGPKEDRYKLLRATGVNTSPVVVLFDDPAGTTGARLAELAGTPAAVDLTDDDGVRHRLWPLPADGDGPESGLAAALIAAGEAAPVTIADGHHRYETALRYRDERRMTRSCEEDPPFDYLLALFLDATDEPLTVLPTHRLVRSLGDDGAAELLRRAEELFVVEPVASASALVEAFDAVALARGGEGRFGLWTRAGGALLRARRHAFEAHRPEGGSAVRQLDVTLLGVALERLAGVDAAAVAAGAIAYDKSAAGAVAAVERGDADAAWLLEGTPVASIEAVAREGDVMPQKSTYFYPKALTGLVINPLEA